jgi:hypothetical protein
MLYNLFWRRERAEKLTDELDQLFSLCIERVRIMSCQVTPCTVNMAASYLIPLHS